MQTNNLKSLFLMGLLSVGLLVGTSCDRDKDNDPDNEQELITTIALTFTSSSGSVTFTARDLDGDGGNPPVVEPVVLNANTNYVLTIKFLDETQTPPEDITKEVQEESDEHLICFAVTGAMPAPAIQDKDDKGKPLGLNSTLRTGAAGTGTLKVTLKHKPNKNAANPCTTGDTDAEQTFSVTIR